MKQQCYEFALESTALTCSPKLKQCTKCMDINVCVCVCVCERARENEWKLRVLNFLKYKSLRGLLACLIPYLKDIK